MNRKDCSGLGRSAVTFAAALTCCATAFAADIVVGGGDRVNVEVGADSSLRQDGAVWVQPGGVLDKTGKGDWTLPLGTIVSPCDTVINVRDGSVTVPADEGDAPAPETPAGTLAKAALWLDPSVKCDLDADGKGVLRLLDVRETATAVPYNYLRAVSMTNNVEAFPQIEGAGQGLKCVNFGAYRSGKWARLTSPESEDGSACSTALRNNIRHIFMIYEIVSSQGFVFSVESNNYISFHPESSSATVNAKLISRDASSAPSQTAAKCHINGVRCDPTATVPPQKSFMVLEFQFCGKAGSLDGFFNDRNNSGRQGGDYIGETLVFTNMLTEVERIQVGRYLSKRWNIPFAQGGKLLKVAKGASVNVPAGTAKISVAGEGKVCVIDGGASVLWRGNPAFHGEVDLPRDVKMAVRDDIYSYNLAASEKLTVNTGIAKGCYSGDEVVRTAGEASDSMAKDGNGSASIRKIPDGVKKLTVSEGVLSLSAPYKTTVVPGSEVSVMIPNSGFEKASSLTASHCYYLYNNWNEANLERTVADWTGRMFVNADGTYSDEWGAFFSAANPNYLTSNFPYKGYPFAPEGDWAFVFRGKGEIETNVDVPVDGTYEFSFMLAGQDSANEADQVIMDVFVGPDESSLVRYIHTIPFKDFGYARNSCVIPQLQKGKNLLRIRTSTKKGSRKSASIDDIRIRLVSDASGGFPVPNGDFEIYSSANIENLSPLYKNCNDFPDGWTFSQVNWSGDASLPSIAIVRYGANISNSSFSQPIANVADWEHGNVQLFLASAKGAKAETSFKAPKPGLYFLKAKVGEFCHGNIYNDSCKLNGRPAIEIAVKQGDGEFSSCGVVTPAGRMMNGIIWPKPVLVSGADTVLCLALSNTVANSAALLDDLEFVPCREAHSANLLDNGGFETDNHWELVHRKGEAGEWNEKSNASYRSFASAYYGYDKGEGARAISLIDAAGCYQKVRFPVPGRYRLRFIMRARDDTTNGKPTYYSLGAKMRAVLAKGSVTNEIVSLASPTTNFVARTVCFDVEDADSDYTFGFEADNDVRISGYKDRMVLIDDASIVYCGDSFADGLREEFQIPEDMKISVAAGAKLYADFAGTRTIAEMRLGGHRVSGVISRETHPEYISGTGTFYVQPKGTCVLFR